MAADARMRGKRVALDLLLGLREPASARGVLLGADGQPAGGRRIRISNRGWLPALPGDITVRTEVVTDARGRWRVQNLAPSVEYFAAVEITGTPTGTSAVSWSRATWGRSN